MTEDEIAVMETAISVYAKKIQQKIESLEDAYREQQFYKWIDTGKVVCREHYKFPSVITPADTTDSIPHSLYEAEKNDMNISKYTRIMLFEDTKISKNSISILVKLQDICEYINAKQKAPDKKLERMLDDVWKSLS